MAETHPSGAADVPGAGSVYGSFGRLIVRLYALAILVVVIWAGYMAVAYLIRTVYYPIRVPKAFMAEPAAPEITRIQEGTMPPLNMPGARVAIGHYHQVDRWPEPDRFNGCTSNGCHSLLPHTQHKESRSFANFHAGFLSCGMCHDENIKPPLKAMWVSTVTGRPQSPPALLQLLALLETQAEQVRSNPAAVSPRIVELLGEAVKVAGDDPLLEYLYIQVSTSEPGSPVWRHSAGQLAADLPNHVRGEYEAKITLEMPETELEQQRRKVFDQSNEYQTTPPGPQRKTLQQIIHAAVLAKPDPCLTCHGGEPPRLDFQALGYPPQRAAALRATDIAKLIQRLREHGTFELPEVEGGNVR